jgi:hypothetical protein
MLHHLTSSGSFLMVFTKWQLPPWQQLWLLQALPLQQQQQRKWHHAVPLVLWGAQWPLLLTHLL